MVTIIIQTKEQVYLIMDIIIFEADIQYIKILPRETQEQIVYFKPYLLENLHLLD
ncbi:hypothetical protein SDC9_23353 [bioreactor metagenome]|uniref:Uncharacterized protein n=1 Tax=bioreactor metagenome TaxID=1076179 RepID=A0A644UEW6_9ZZZZ